MWDWAWLEKSVVLCPVVALGAGGQGQLGCGGGWTDEKVGLFKLVLQTCLGSGTPPVLAGGVGVTALALCQVRGLWERRGLGRIPHLQPEAEAHPMRDVLAVWRQDAEFQSLSRQPAPHCKEPTLQMGKLRPREMVSSALATQWEVGVGL